MNEQTYPIICKNRKALYRLEFNSEERLNRVDAGNENWGISVGVYPRISRSLAGASDAF